MTYCSGESASLAVDRAGRPGRLVRRRDRTLRILARDAHVKVGRGGAQEVAERVVAGLLRCERWRFLGVDLEAAFRHSGHTPRVLFSVGGHYDARVIALGDAVRGEVDVAHALRTLAQRRERAEPFR